MVGRTGAAPTAHEISQFLNLLLSQRGPQALPYVEDDKWSIRQHLLLVIQEFPGLQVRSLSFPLFSLFLEFSDRCLCRRDLHVIVSS